MPGAGRLGDRRCGLRQQPGVARLVGARQLPYVLAVKATEPLPSASGPPTPAARPAGRVPPHCWLRLSAGQGAKGRRWYAWSRLPLASAGAPDGWERWLLLRRSLRTRGAGVLRVRRPGRPAADRAGAGGRGPLAGGRGVPGRQGAVRPGPAPGPPLALLVPLGDAGMLAYAFLVVAAVIEHARHPAPPGVIELTCNEIQHLVAALVAAPVADTGHRLRWSWWRRRQQARARACHYRRQAAQHP
jgi:hypothetical protein